MRIGLAAVRGLGTPLTERIVAERAAHGPDTSPEDLVRRVPRLSTSHLEALATAGAFGCFRLDRREALWVAGAVAQAGPDRLSGIITGTHPPPLPGLSDLDEARADLWATGISPDGHPTRFVRSQLDNLGVVPAGHTVGPVELAEGEEIAARRGGPSPRRAPGRAERGAATGAHGYGLVAALVGADNRGHELEVRGDLHLLQRQARLAAHATRFERLGSLVSAGGPAWLVDSSTDRRLGTWGLVHPRSRRGKGRRDQGVRAPPAVSCLGRRRRT